jgi:hypothetical protein
MKRKIYIATGLLLAASALTGCSDSFLTVESPTQSTSDEYFTTDAHIQEAVVAAYDPLHWPDWAMSEYNPVNIMSDIMADDLWVGGSDRTDNANWHYMMNFEAQGNFVISGLWTDAYSGVKRCNDVIGYLANPDVTDVTEANAKYYEAQVRVLRVYYYNWLWKFWGNVVYYETNFEGSPYLGTQYTADEVYDFMINDLEGAIALDALPMKESDDNVGRVTKAMAYMLYAEIVMYQNDESRYATALKYMQEIISSGKYSLNPDYANIFKESGEWTDESIFEVNYKDDNAIRDWSNPLAAGGTVLPTLLSPNNWPSGTDGHDGGWGFCPVRQETYDRYEEGDVRRDATCWNAGALGVDYNKRYQDTGLFLEKYAAHTGDNADQKASSELNWNNNLRIYRYSETLLNAAELIIRGAGSGDAKGYLDQVRTRAGVGSVAATLDNIIEERHLEFVGEGKRYWDLIRTGKAASVLVPDQYGYRTNSWTSNKKYLPIPQSEIDKARGTLTQNNY